MNDYLNILFIGDIFGKSGIKKVEKELDNIKEKYQIDLVIAQSENVSGRKGFNKEDYEKLSQIGIDIFTIGNHVWANKEIYNFIDNNNIIRPLNISNEYPGKGVGIFEVKGKKVKVASVLGITFNELLKPWKQEKANNFFDAIDIEIKKNDYDFFIVDFHAETTSEKYVFGNYLDKMGVDAMLGTHTHVQTNDAKILKNNLAFISDVGMTGPIDSSIGVEIEAVYQKMRFNNKLIKFEASNNESEFNGVVLNLNKKGSKITPLKFI
ncbi:MAG: TIGR00282 family metallophosphoesterase [Metamycoplasmataceae bacterium]